MEDEDRDKVARVKLCNLQMPQVGDKFAPMQSKKGNFVMVFTQKDLPFTTKGLFHT